MAASTASKIAGARRSKKYKALIAADFDDAQALQVLGLQVEEEENPLVTQLVASGFTREQAEAAVALQGGTTATTTTTSAKAKDEKGYERLVSESPYEFTRGRVYVNTEVLETMARVLKTGKAKIVKTSGAGHTKAVVVFRTDTGDIAVQNLA